MPCFRIFHSSKKKRNAPKKEYTAPKKEHFATMKEFFAPKEKTIVDRSYYARIPKKNPGRTNLKVHFDEQTLVIRYTPREEYSEEDLEKGSQKVSKKSSGHTSKPSSKLPIDPLAVVRAENARLATQSAPESTSSTNTKTRPRVPTYICNMFKDDDDFDTATYGHDPFKHYNTFDRIRAHFAKMNLTARNPNDPKIYEPPQSTKPVYFVTGSLASSAPRSSVPTSASSPPRPSLTRSYTPASSSPGPSSSASSSSSSSSTPVPVRHRNPNTTVDGFYYVHNKYIFRQTMKAFRQRRESIDKGQEELHTKMGARHSLKLHAFKVPQLSTIIEVEEPEEHELLLQPYVHIPPYFLRHDNIVDAEAVTLSAVSSTESLTASSLNFFEGDYIRFYDAVVGLFSFLCHGFGALFGRQRD